MLVRPRILDLACGIKIEHTSTYQRDDNILGSQDLQLASGQSGLSQRTVVIDRKRQAAMQGDSDGGTFSRTESLSETEAHKPCNLVRIGDAACVKILSSKSSLVSSQLFRIGIGNFIGDMVSGQKVARTSTDQVHPVDFQEIDEDRRIRHDDRRRHLPTSPASIGACRFS
jgi:hypothetical protein